MSSSSLPSPQSVAAGGAAAAAFAATEQQLVQAITLMYAGDVRAKDWLLQLMNSPLSWRLPVRVLQSAGASHPDAADVSFYCANILAKKVLTGWTVLPGAEREQMLQFLWGCLGREPRFSRLVHERVAITLARAVLQSQAGVPRGGAAFAAGSPAGAGGESRVEQCIGRCLKLARADPARNSVTALAVLVALATEITAVPITSRQRESLEQNMAARHGSVASFLLFVLNSAGKDAAALPLAAATFAAARRWVPHGLNLAQLTMRHTGLLQVGFKFLTNGGAEHQDVILQVARLVEAALEPESRQSLQAAQLPPERMTALVGGLVAGINSTADRFKRACRAGRDNDGEAAVAQAMTRLSSAALEAFPGFVCKGAHASCIPLVQYILAQTANPDRSTAALTLDAWSCVQDVPLVERCPALREPVLRRLFDLLVQQCTLPPEARPTVSPSGDSDFGGEGDDNDDDDAIGAFRVGPPGCMDLLGSLISTIPAYTIQKVVHVFKTGALGAGAADPGAAESWVNREAALFVLCKVAGDCPPEAAGPALRAVFETITKQPALMSLAPRLTATTCRLIGAYARSVLKKPTFAAQLQFALKYFLFTLRHAKGPVLPEVAAKALAATCTACKRTLASREQILKLVVAIDAAAEGGMATKARVQLAKAISQLVTTYAAPVLCSKPESSQHIADLIGKCAAQNCARLQRFMAEAGKLNANKSSPRRQQFAAGVAGELECLTSLLRWLHFAAAGKEGVTHPLRHVLSKLWPVLEILPAHFLDSRVIMRELAELYRVIFLALQRDTITILPRMLTNLNDVYCTHGLSACLNTFKAAFEMFGGMPEVQSLFQGLIKRVCEVTFSWVTSEASKFAEDPELVATFFETMHEALVFCPAALLLNPVLPNLFKLALRAADTDARKASQATLRFLALLLDRKARGKYGGASLADEARYRITAIVKQDGEQLVCVLLKGIAGKANASVYTWLGNVLWYFATEYAGPVTAWLQAGLRSPIFAGVPGFTDAAKRTVVVAVKAYATDLRPDTEVQKQRFLKLLVRVLCKFCRREADIDDVMAHPKPVPRPVVIALSP